MYPTTLAALKAKHPDREVLVASMGAIEKPNGDIRPIHDAHPPCSAQQQDSFQRPITIPWAGRTRLVSYGRWTETREARFFHFS